MTKSCPSFDFPKDILEKIKQRSSGNTEPDPLKVLRDVKQTEERVKRKELHALRKTVARLTQETQNLTAEKRRGHDQAQRRIQELETDIACIKVQVEKLEKVAEARLKMLPWAPVTWRPWAPMRKYLPSKILPVIKQADKVDVMPIKTPVQEGSNLVNIILTLLPYVGISALIGLATSYLLPDEKRTLKFVGYSASIGVFLVGIGSALPSTRYRE
jgi:hypothetical protein